ncbi:MAG: hypothetical protein J0H41_05170 [Rhizobiales bacterium]|nr:hypothetical protein [Hyphomicrobiales bacterium]
MSDVQMPTPNSSWLRRLAWCGLIAAALVIMPLWLFGLGWIAWETASLLTTAAVKLIGGLSQILA